MSEAPYGYCRCGCGERTPIAKRNEYRRGHLKGEPVPYLPSHGPTPKHKGTRMLTSEQIDEAVRRFLSHETIRSIAERFACHPNTVSCCLRDRGVTQGNRGPKPITIRKRAVTSHGYVRVGSEYEHRIVAARKIGRDLSPDEQVHHIDGNKQNNHPDNLHVFASANEHTKEHMEDAWLPEDDWLLLRMKASGMAADAIAEVLGAGVNAVRNRWRRLQARGVAWLDDNRKDRPSFVEAAPNEVRWAVRDLRAMNALTGRTVTRRIQARTR